MSIAYNTSIVTSGLITCLDAANSKSYPGTGTIWTDLSGNGNNVTLTNGPTFNSENGGSIVFDGTNDYAVTGSSASLSMNNSSVTVDIWIKITNFASGERMICEYGIWSATEVYQFTTIGNTLRFNFPAAFSAGKATDYVYSPLTTNVWMHLVGMHNTSTNEGNIYVNGLLAATTTGVTQEIGAGTAALYIASRGGTTLYLPCSIGQLKIYNKALSSVEVAQNFNALRGRYGI